MKRLRLFAFLFCLSPLLSGCLAIGAAALVTETAIGTVGTVAETAINVGGAAVDAVTPGDDDDDDD